MPNNPTRFRNAAAKNFNVTDHFFLGGTEVTATAAEINALASNGLSSAELGVLDAVTAGTVSASKAVVADANLTVTGLRRPVLTKNANYTVTTADSGALIYVTSADKVMTLPSTAAGLTYTFVITTAGLSASTGLSISPAAADKIMGNGLTAADNKDAINSGATDRDGDSLTIVGDGVDGWFITAVTGTWAREA